MPNRPFSPFSNFIHLRPEGDATLLKFEPALWKRLRDDPPKGRLAGGVRLRKNTGWEMHPDGDELLILLSGSIRLLLDDGESETIVKVSAGKAFVVPRGVWHRQLVNEPGDLLFFTPGPRTETRPVVRGSTPPAA